MYILKCSECGNTFKTDSVQAGELISCPICETDFRVAIVDGKVKLKEFIYEEVDSGELLS